MIFFERVSIDGKLACRQVERAVLRRAEEPRCDS